MITQYLPAVERGAAEAPRGGVDHRQAPLLEALRADREAGPVLFSAPGHKRGAGAGEDVRALLGDAAFAGDGWLGVADHDPLQRRAEDLAAAAWGADRSFFLTHGSSGGTHALLLSILAPGDEVVVARDVHQSVLVAILLAGARPVYVVPRPHPALGVGLGIAAADVAAALAAHPAAKLVVLTSPTYWGVASDVAAIADVAHKRNVAVYVDEAWGAHFSFHPALPPSAMASRADAAVTSAHKLLATLRQGALLHVRGPRLDVDRIASTVRLTQTTSPSLPILTALDACRSQMALDGERLLDGTLGLALGARRRLGALPGLTVLGGAQFGEVAYDPTRLVIDVRGLGLSGFRAERALRSRFGIAPAMSDPANVVCVFTIGDTPESVDRLVDAFTALAAERRPVAPVIDLGAYRAALAPGRQAMAPCEAFFARTRSVPLAAAVGEVAAELVIPYPPGIPALVPGEEIATETVAYLEDGLMNGMTLRGPADPRLTTIRVVAERDPPWPPLPS